MKATRFIALALALITASSLFACSSDQDNKEDDDGAEETTSIAPLDMPGLPEDRNAPITDEVIINSLFDAGYDLTENIINPSVAGMTIWDDGAVENFFDGNVSSTKLGGKEIIFPVDVTWETDIPTALKTYIVYSGNDSADWPGRAPISWTLYGSNDGENWNVIDEVAQSGIGNVNATPFAYLVDAPAVYTHYKFSITSTNGPVEDGGIEVQLNELLLIGDIITE